jgi:hypothetical protein
MQSLIDRRNFERFTGVAACGNTVLVTVDPRRVLCDDQ